MKPTRLWKIVIVTTSATLMTSLLTGCSNLLESVDQAIEQNQGGQSQSGSVFSMQDLMFAQMMIPHHQQAVDMGVIAESLAQSSQVLELARQIKGEQEPEIAQMQGWLGGESSNLHMGHEMPMSGMLSETQMAQLLEARGAEFDRLFLIGMIAHHEGALAMTKMVVDSKNQEVRSLAESIIDSQTQQIEYMKQLLETLK